MNNAGVALWCSFLDWPRIYPRWVWDCCIQDSGAGHFGNSISSIKRTSTGNFALYPILSFREMGWWRCHLVWASFKIHLFLGFVVVMLPWCKWCGELECNHLKSFSPVYNHKIATIGSQCWPCILTWLRPYLNLWWNILTNSAMKKIFGTFIFS